MKISYDWLSTYFEHIPPVEEVAEKLMFHSFEIEGVDTVGDDRVIDIDVLPNRAHDCLSHRGIAREVSALYNIAMKNDPLAGELHLEPRSRLLEVSIDKESSCSEYGTAIIQGVTVRESPEWLKKRLEAIGQRSINNIVDATNYVMFGLGTPLHAFDLDTLTMSDGMYSLAVRRAENAQSITVLGGDTYELDNTMSVIVDGVRGAALAIAGVKGGVVAEVGMHTKNIVLEAAKFHPTITRKTAQKLKLRTDSSARFENEISDILPPYGLQEVVSLILKIAGGELEGYATAYSTPALPESITLTITKINSILGTDIDMSTAVSLLQGLNFTVEQEGETLTVIPPRERLDVTIPEDVIEEVGRMYGYEHIQSLVFDDGHPTNVTKYYFAIDTIRNTLVEAGYTEVYVHSLQDTGEMKLTNALASHKDHYRVSLRNGLLALLAQNERNMPVLGHYDVLRIFEVGKGYSEGKEQAYATLAVHVAGKKKRAEKIEKELLSAKQLIETALGVTIPDPEGNVLEINLTNILETLTVPDEYATGKAIASDMAHTPLSAYPFIQRDLAVWVPEGVSPEEIVRVITEYAGELLVRTDIFDEFTKEGRTSYAFHIIFQSHEKTLTDVEVGEIMEQITNDLNARDGFETR